MSRNETFGAGKRISRDARRPIKTQGSNDLSNYAVENVNFIAALALLENFYLKFQLRTETGIVIKLSTIEYSSVIDIL